MNNIKEKLGKGQGIIAIGGVKSLKKLRVDAHGRDVYHGYVMSKEKLKAVLKSFSSDKHLHVLDYYTSATANGVWAIEFVADKEFFN